MSVPILPGCSGAEVAGVGTGVLAVVVVGLAIEHKSKECCFDQWY